MFESTHLLRQANKAVLGHEIVNSEPSFELIETRYLIDGGYLIQKLNWPRGRTYNELCRMNVKYVDAWALKSGYYTRRFADEHKEAELFNAHNQL